MSWKILSFFFVENSKSVGIFQKLNYVFESCVVFPRGQSHILLLKLLIQFGEIVLSFQILKENEKGNSIEKLEEKKERKEKWYGKARDGELTQIDMAPD